MQVQTLKQNVSSIMLMAFAASFLWISAPEITRAESVGSITVLQEGTAQGSIGSWTLIRPDNTELTIANNEEFSVHEAELGRYTLIIDKPDGATATVTTYVNGEERETNTTPQVAFELLANDSVLVHVTYVTTKSGTVSVSTDPAGLRFTLSGPNDTEWSGKTPESFDDVPVGMYSVEFQEFPGCPSIPVKSNRLEEDGRISLDVTISCAAMNEVLDTEYEKQLKYVTVKKDGKTIVFTDAPMEDWYASHVYTVVKTGIMSGYKDANGNLTGQFGPGDTVTIAQLAKIAHGLAGIDEREARGALNNTRATGTWFEAYYRSAEKLHWQVFQDPHQNPGRPALRSEVVATILQALDIGRVWPKGEIFRDVDPSDRFAASIETAAVDGVISGSGGGNTFNPNSTINRAELAKIAALAIEEYIEDSPEIQ